METIIVPRDIRQLNSVLPAPSYDGPTTPLLVSKQADAAPPSMADAPSRDQMPKRRMQSVQQVPSPQLQPKTPSPAPPKQQQQQQAFAPYPQLRRASSPGLQRPRPLSTPRSQMQPVPPHLANRPPFVCGPVKEQRHPSPSPMAGGRPSSQQQQPPQQAAWAPGPYPGYALRGGR